MWYITNLLKGQTFELCDLLINIFYKNSVHPLRVNHSGISQPIL